MQHFTANHKMAKRYRKKSSKRTYRKRKPKVAKKKPMVKLIQSVINKNLEDKAAWRAQTDINFNSAINAQADVYGIMPSIGIGTGDASRVGAQLHGKSLVITGHMISNLTNFAYSDCRIGVRLMIVSPKGYLGFTPAFNSAVTWLSYLLRRGATTVGYTGLISDLYTPINTDAITCHYDRRFYVTSPYVPGLLEGAIPVTGSTKFFRISLPCNRIFKYDSAVDSGLLPTNYNPFVILGYSHLDGSTPDTVQTQINLSWTCKFRYQDA